MSQQKRHKENRRNPPQTGREITEEKKKRGSISVEEFRSIAAYTSYGHSNYMKDEMIVYEYRATPEVLVTLWKILRPHLQPTSEPCHMLWWLYSCKHYPTKHLFQKAMRVSAPTSRKHMEPIKIAFLKVRNKVVRKINRNDAQSDRILKYFAYFFSDTIQ